jgi:Protein of unknown function (DUF1552)
MNQFNKNEFNESHTLAMKKELFSRRKMLQGLGIGAFLFNPLINQLAAEAQSGKVPKLLIMFTPNGFFMNKMTATKTASGEFAGRPIFKDSLAILEEKQLSQHIAVLKNLDSTMETDGFARSHEQQAALLTGFSTKMNNGNKNFQLAQGPSLDWIQAKRFSQEPLGLGVMFNQSSAYKHLWSNTGVPNDPANDPTQLLKTLFPTAQNAQNQQEILMNARRNNIRDLVLADAKKLRERLDSSDRIRLDPYIEGLDTLKKSIVNPAMVCEPPKFPAVSSWTDKKFWKERAVAHLEIIAQAFSCNYRNVATLSFGNGVGGDNVVDVFKDVHHEWSHTTEKMLNPAETICKIDAVYASFYADILLKFKSMNLLQDVMVLWISELVDGNGHNQDNRQWLLGGGGAGKIQTGKVHDFTGQAKERCLNRLCTTLANAMGDTRKSFGDAGLTTEGPLPGLLT